MGKVDRAHSGEGKVDRGCGPGSAEIEVERGAGARPVDLEELAVTGAGDEGGAAVGAAEADVGGEGVVDRVVPADELFAAAEEFARGLAVGPTRAYSVVKQLGQAYLAGGIAGADTMLVDAAVGLFDTEDARGAIDTFLSKGPGQAVFTGR